jgi:hypothetical protein
MPGGADRTCWFASPEDVVLKKMEAHREGGPDKHLRDIAGIIKTMHSELDAKYIDEWAERLGVLDIWRTVQQRVGKP